MPTSMDKAHVCVNGMSFSKRSSKWANSALVVTVHPADSAVAAVAAAAAGEGGSKSDEWPAVLAGVAFQVNPSLAPVTATLYVRTKKQKGGLSLKKCPLLSPSSPPSNNFPATAKEI